MNWISVEDQLPEYGVEVLVEVDGHRSPCWRNNYNLVAYRSSYDGEFRQERHEDEIVFGVTHWMYLPPPPEYKWHKEKVID